MLVHRPLQYTVANATMCYDHMLYITKLILNLNTGKHLPVRIAKSHKLFRLFNPTFTSVFSCVHLIATSGTRDAKQAG